MAKRRGERVGPRPEGWENESLRLHERLKKLPRPEDGQAAEAKEVQDLALDLIVPDPIQARRPIPELLRLNWLSGTPLFDILTDWAEEAAEAIAKDWEHKQPDHKVQEVRWGDWIEGQVEPREVTSPDPTVGLWIQLVQLAANIYLEGLHRPIIVFPLNDTYFQIMCGERRFLAYNFLDWMGYPGYKLIPVKILDDYNPYYQAIENGVREDLNAIGVARQLAILLKVTNNHVVTPQASVGQNWYAEAADLSPPYGKGDQIAVMLGLPNWRTASRYRKLLTLPTQVWHLADEFSWTEGRLRGMMRKAQNEEHLVLLAQDAMQKDLSQDKREPLSPREKANKQAASLHSSMRRALKMDKDQIDTIQPDLRRQLYDTAREIVKRFK